MQKIRIFLFLWMIFGSIFFGPSVIAAQSPPDWPWRGVNIDSLGTNGPDDLASIARELPLNSFSLVISPVQYARQKGVPVAKSWKESLIWLDGMLGQCRELNLNCIISANEFPFEAGSPKLQEEDFWSDEESLRQVIGWIEQLARRYSKTGPELAAYDFISEPVLLDGGKARRPPQWFAFQQRIIEAIRKYDQNRWIVVKPGPWGGPNGYRGLSPFAEDPKLIYSFHMYLPHEFTHQKLRNWRYAKHRYPGVIGASLWDKNALKRAMQPVAEFAEKYQVPIWVGEFSAVRWAEGGEQYLDDLVDVFDEYGWGWAYWSFAWWHGWNPNYDDQFFEGSSGWEEHWLGTRSRRWQTLREMFESSPKNSAEGSTLK